jgi:hypothetical protein
MKFTAFTLDIDNVTTSLFDCEVHVYDAYVVFIGL